MLTSDEIIGLDINTRADLSQSMMVSKYTISVETGNRAAGDTNVSNASVREHIDAVINDLERRIKAFKDLAEAVYAD